MEILDDKASLREHKRSFKWMAHSGRVVIEYVAKPMIFNRIIRIPMPKVKVLDTFNLQDI